MSAQVFTPKQAKHKPSHEKDGQPQRNGGMQALAEREVQFHTAPLPEAQALEVDPFPRRVMLGLVWGVIGGGLVGLFFGLLLLRGGLHLRGWEGLYSMGPFTFYTFWTFAGIALGVLIIGVATLLRTTPDGHTVEKDRVG